MSVSLDKTPVQSDTRRDLGAHITEVFYGMQVGEFLTAAQISNVCTTEYGSEVKPSTGAIVARLFPASGVCTLAGVRPAFHPTTNARGAMKVVTFEVGGLVWETAPVRPILPS